MVFRRSEEHLERWLDRNGWEPGASMSATTLNELAQRWWRTRLDPDWRPVIWTQAERAKGQAWGLQTVSTLNSHGTPPVPIKNHGSH